VIDITGGKWLASHGRVDGIEDAQAIDIRHTANGDGSSFGFL
jgi:hypothetical protein